MLRPGNEVQVCLYAGPVDMRKSIDDLSVLVEQEIELSPAWMRCLCFAIADETKSNQLCWERNGFIVWYKRLEK